VIFVLDNPNQPSQHGNMHLISIFDKSGPEKIAAPTPLEMLLGCHARIRHFIQLSRTLATAENVPPQEVADAAAAIFRYFSLALPLHEADEDKSLLPRIQAALPLGNLAREAAETMVEQHKAIDELAAELLSICSSLDRNPDRLPALARRLEHVTSALEQILAAHLRLEETVIFPVIQELLSPAQIEEMLAEMNERRRVPRGAIHLVQ
jgi:iron-sulfur cluster repair protein YtfE (RIC family)